MSIDNPPSTPTPPSSPEVPPDPTSPEPFAPTPDEPSPFVSGSPAGLEDPSSASGVDVELTPSNVDPDIDPDPS